MSRCVQELYEPAIRPARLRFARSPALAAFWEPGGDERFLELFLMHFSSLGVGLTQPVEDWLVRAGKRCQEVGQPELGGALLAHSKQEAGHHLMMIRDTHSLVARWNARQMPRLSAKHLLERPPTLGGRMYQQLHEDNIAGDTPFAQIAIEYEIEMLPVQLGPQLLQKCTDVLGDGILGSMSFLHEHITLDVAHTRFNERQLEHLLQRNGGYLPALVRAGGAALEAYAVFLNDCVQLAQAQTREPAGHLTT